MESKEEVLTAPELIVCSAIQWEGEVHFIPAPARHIDVVLYMAERGFPPKATYSQGFITTAGRFVDRIEAFRLAEQGGQLKGEPKQPPNLYSEDLW